MKTLTMSVVGLRACNVILGDFSHTLLALYAVFGVYKQILEHSKPSNWLCDWNSQQLFIHLQIGTGICAFLKGEAGTVGEVNKLDRLC